MNYTPPNSEGSQSEPTRRVASEARWTARRVSRTLSKPLAARLTRRFDIEWFDGTEIQSLSHVAPALPAFEQAFGAFAHGVLIHTTDGPIAVEDLEPGMMLDLPNGRVSQLLWKGAITLVPGAPASADQPDKLYRVMPDAFGLGRPVQDQTFGPHARRIDRDPKLRSILGAEAAMVPLSAMADGVGVIEVNPVTPTRVYHLACESHETILAAGMEVETYHPGPDVAISLSEEMMRHFLAFFPHLGHIRDFGRLCAPRLNADDLLSIA